MRCRDRARTDSVYSGVYSPGSDVAEGLSEANPGGLEDRLRFRLLTMRERSAAQSGGRIGAASVLGIRALAQVVRQRGQRSGGCA